MSEQSKLLVGRYRLDSIVGSGSSAQVWSAWDTALARAVAIKILHPKGEQEKQRIWREARLAALLGSFAVPIYDYGDDGNRCFLVMELVEEPNLRTFLTETTLQSSAVIGIAKHLLEGLAHAHDMSIIHRDVKPENIFVGGTSEKIDRVRLVDFGLAFVKAHTALSLGRLTEEQVLSGTPAYLSPEQAKGIEIGRESDIYSAGCVLYEVSCGKAPFEGDLGELLSKHMYVPAIPLQDRDVKLPHALMQLVDAMLSKSPSERPSSKDALAIIDALHEDSPDLATSRRPSGHASREERMVAAAASSVAPAHRVHATVVGEDPPSWLVEKLKAASVMLPPLDGPPDFILSPSAHVPATADLPIVVWSAGESLSLSSLIKAGIAFALSPDTPVAGLHRTLQGLIAAANRKGRLL